MFEYEKEEIIDHPVHASSITAIAHPQKLLPNRCVPHSLPPMEALTLSHIQGAHYIRKAT